jgi:hypothetical protein
MKNWGSFSDIYCSYLLGLYTSIKETVSREFPPSCFIRVSSPRTLIIPLGLVWFFSQRYSQLKVDQQCQRHWWQMRICGKSAAGVNDTGGQLAAGVVDTGGAPSRIFENKLCYTGNTRGAEEDESWKKHEVKKSRDTVPLRGCILTEGQFLESYFRTVRRPAEVQTSAGVRRQDAVLSK